jgi:hypothetical protein
MVAHKNTFHRHLFTGFFQCILLLGITALPSLAFAVDTDGDGVDDSIDAFPNNAEATTDTDGDGMPDSINESMLPIIFSDSFEGAAQPGWTGIAGAPPILGSSWTLSTNPNQAHSGSGSLAGWANISGTAKVYTTVNIPAQGGTVSYWHKIYAGCANNIYCTFQTNNPFQVYQNSLFTAKKWVKSTYPLNAGSTELRWFVHNCGSSGGGSSAIQCGYLDDVEVRANSLLVDDLDDDNDGLPDVMDPLPLQAKFNLNAPYKGSQVLDKSAMQ